VLFRSLTRQSGVISPVLAASRALVVAALLLPLLLLGSCRNINSATSPTSTGNYIITITGTLGSNAAVQVTTTVDLSVT